MFFLFFLKNCQLDNWLRQCLFFCVFLLWSGLHTFGLLRLLLDHIGWMRWVEVNWSDVGMTGNWGQIYRECKRKNICTVVTDLSTARVDSWPYFNRMVFHLNNELFRILSEITWIMSLVHQFLKKALELWVELIHFQASFTWVVIWIKRSFSKIGHDSNGIGLKGHLSTNKVKLISNMGTYSSEFNHKSIKNRTFFTWVISWFLPIISLEILFNFVSWTSSFSGQPTSVLSSIS